MILTETFPAQFNQALTNIEVSGEKLERAAQAHDELREVLGATEELQEAGLSTALIGSYARHTGIYPGRDVDVFAKLAELDRSSEPQAVFEAVSGPLVAHYGTRAQPQRRSIKVSFGEDDDSFAVDAVPAVRSGAAWALPNRERDAWEDADRRWIETDPERLNEIVTRRNERPTIDGRGAFVPAVKLVRQIRHEHRGDLRPGGLYFELLVYWAFERGVQGTSYAEILAATLQSIADQLASGEPAADPVLGGAYQPPQEEAEVAAATRIFAELAADSQRALGEPRCPAAAIWRRVIGSNTRGACFPLPEGCDETGRELVGAVSAVRTRGSREAGGFGR